MQMYSVSPTWDDERKIPIKIVESFLVEVPYSLEVQGKTIKRIGNFTKDYCFRFRNFDYSQLGVAIILRVGRTSRGSSGPHPIFRVALLGTLLSFGIRRVVISGGIFFFHGRGFFSENHRVGWVEHFQGRCEGEVMMKCDAL